MTDAIPTVGMTNSERWHDFPPRTCIIRCVQIRVGVEEYGPMSFHAVHVGRDSVRDVYGEPPSIDFNKIPWTIGPSGR